MFTDIIIFKWLVIPASKLVFGLVAGLSASAIGFITFGLYAYFNGLAKTVTDLKNVSSDSYAAGRELFLWFNESVSWSASSVYGGINSIYESNWFSYSIQNIPKALDMTHYFPGYGVSEVSTSIAKAASQGANGSMACYYYWLINLQTTYTVIIQDSWPKLVNVLVFSDSGSNHAVGVSLRFIITFLEHLKGLHPVLTKVPCTALIGFLESNIAGLREATVNVTTSAYLPNWAADNYLAIVQQHNAGLCDIGNLQQSLLVSFAFIVSLPIRSPFYIRAPRLRG